MWMGEFKAVDLQDTGVVLFFGMAEVSRTLTRGAEAETTMQIAYRALRYLITGSGYL
jgi:hypothetical protein